MKHILKWLAFIEKRHYLLVPLFFILIFCLLYIGSLFMEGGPSRNPYRHVHWHGFSIKSAMEDLPENFRLSLLCTISSYIIYLIVARPWKKAKAG
jgi:hypothetical protein